MRTKAFLWTLMGCLVAPPIATAQDVYSSMGNQIQKLTITTAPPATARAACTPVGRWWAIWLFALVIPTFRSGRPESISVLRRTRLRRPRSDQPNQCRSGTVRVAAMMTLCGLKAKRWPIGEIRLTMVAASLSRRQKGVQVSGAIPFRPARTGADCRRSGLAIAFNGSLRFSDDNQVKSPAGFNATADGAIVGLGIANGGPAQHCLCSSRLGTYVPPPQNKIKCGPKAARTTLCWIRLAEFEVDEETSAGSAQYFEFLTSDVAIVATSIDPNARSGELSTGSCGGSPRRAPTELFRAPGCRASRLRERVSLFYAPIVGVAVGPSGANVHPWRRWNRPSGGVRPGGGRCGDNSIVQPDLSTAPAFLGGRASKAGSVT